MCMGMPKSFYEKIKPFYFFQYESEHVMLNFIYASFRVSYPGNKMHISKVDILFNRICCTLHKYDIINMQEPLQLGLFSIG